MIYCYDVVFIQASLRLYVSNLNEGIISSSSSDNSVPADFTEESAAVAKKRDQTEPVHRLDIRS